MYNQIIVANTIIKKTNILKILDLNNIKLQKLMYLAHAWVLTLTGDPLIDEEFYVFKSGPTLPSVYSHFYKLNNVFVKGTQNHNDAVIKCENVKDFIVDNIIDKVLHYYGYCCVEELNKKINVKKGPWHTALKNNDCMISNKLIQKHMEGVLDKIKKLV